MIEYLVLFAAGFVSAYLLLGLTLVLFWDRIFGYFAQRQMNKMMDEMPNPLPDEEFGGEFDE